jgi:hypothetical protein
LFQLVIEKCTGKQLEVIVVIPLVPFYLACTQVGQLTPQAYLQAEFFVFLLQVGVSSIVVFFVKKTVGLPSSTSVSLRVAHCKTWRRCRRKHSLFLTGFQLSAAFQRVGSNPPFAVFSVNLPR